MRFLLVSTALAATVAAPVRAQHIARDTAGVHAAVLDYIDGIYRTEPSRIERSVDPGLVKVGFWWVRDSSRYASEPMSYEQLLDIARTWNKNRRVDPDKAPKEIVVLDVLDQTAVAKLTAVWGVDYFQLARRDGRWKIIHVIWQSPPRNP